MSDEEFKVYGYINTQTSVMIAGRHEVFDALSDPQHYDNRARLETFSPETPDGVLDWRRITVPTEWATLCKKHKFSATAKAA